MQTQDVKEVEKVAHHFNEKGLQVFYFDGLGEPIKEDWDRQPKGQSKDITEIPEDGSAHIGLGRQHIGSDICALMIDSNAGGRATLAKLGLNYITDQAWTVREDGKEFAIFSYRGYVNQGGGSKEEVSVERYLGPGVEIIEAGSVPIPPSEGSEWVSSPYELGLKGLPEVLTTTEALPSNEESHSHGPFQRTDARKLISEGMKTPEPISDFATLYSGKVHAFQAESHVGKTYAAYKHVISLARRGKDVVLMEYENGEEDAINQLKALGARDEDFAPGGPIHIYDSSTCSLSEAERFRNLIDVIRPALIVWDNMASALSVAGLNEDSNKDCSDWHNAYTKPLRAKGVATLILDHVVKADDRRGRHAKGAVAKFNECDVIWNLSQPERFTPKQTGKIRLELKKAKSGLTPPDTLDFKAGGPNAVFEGTRQQADLGEVQKLMFGALEDGMDWTEWKQAAGEAGVKRQRFTDTRDALINKGVVRANGDSYYTA